MMNRLLLTAAYLLGVSTASAQTPDYARQMAAANAAVAPPDQPTIDAAVLATIRTIANRTPGQCVPSRVRVDHAIAPATADRFATLGIAAGKLRNVWTVSGQAEGCADAPRSRFMLLALPDGQVRALLVNRGEMLAWPSLMRDTSTGAAIAAMRTIRTTDATCDGHDIALVDARVTSRSGDLGSDFYGVRYAGSWTEAWTFQSCGHRAAVPIAFRADGTGGAYNQVDAQKVELLDR